MGATKHNLVHVKEDTYMLQRKVRGKWLDMEEVLKQGATRKARSACKKFNTSTRVINTSKRDVVYVECDPKI